MSGVCKAFGATRALRGVSFDVGVGEVHALIGENGAGKSTLMKILSGVHRPDSGQMEMDGVAYRPGNPMEARRSGVSMIYQELTLAPHLSVEENITLGMEPATWGWISGSARRRIAREVLAQLHHEAVPVAVPVGRLTVAGQQIVEIARALVWKPRVLVMDEPTSSLTQSDAEDLFEVIGKLKASGVSVIYISHFLEECQRVCDRFTVLRDGETVAAGGMRGASLPDLVRHMVGRDMREIYPKVARERGAVVLSVRGLAGLRRPLDASFDLHAGEILGVAGLVGAGRTETLRGLFGLDRLAAGSVICFGAESTQATPGSRLASGVGMLSEDRKEEGLMLQRDLADNLTLTCYGSVSRFGFVQRARQVRSTRDWMERLEVKARDAGQNVGELSGGNQQKIALGRLLHHEAKILLLDEPTRGIDVGSKAHIYRLMGQLAAEGRAVLMVSSYLPELMGVCDRIAVMCRGRLVEVRATEDWTEHAILTAAIGCESELEAVAGPEAVPGGVNPGGEA